MLKIIFAIVLLSPILYYVLFCIHSFTSCLPLSTFLCHVRKLKSLQPSLVILFRVCFTFAVTGITLGVLSSKPISLLTSSTTFMNSTRSSLMWPPEVMTLMLTGQTLRGKGYFKRDWPTGVRSLTFWVKTTLVDAVTLFCVANVKLWYRIALNYLACTFTALFCLCVCEAGCASVDHHSSHQHLSRKTFRFLLINLQFLRREWTLSLF